jgi:hypothetical protein
LSATVLLPWPGASTVLFAVGVITQARVIPHVAEAVVVWVIVMVANLQTGRTFAHERLHDKARNPEGFAVYVDLQVPAVRVHRKFQHLSTQTTNRNPRASVSYHAVD